MNVRQRAKHKTQKKREKTPIPVNFSNTESVRTFQQKDATPEGRALSIISPDSKLNKLTLQKKSDILGVVVRAVLDLVHGETDVGALVCALEGRDDVEVLIGQLAATAGVPPWAEVEAVDGVRVAIGRALQADLRAQGYAGVVAAKHRCHN